MGAGNALSMSLSDLRLGTLRSCIVYFEDFKSFSSDLAPSVALYVLLSFRLLPYRDLQSTNLAISTIHLVC